MSLIRRASGQTRLSGSSSQGCSYRILLESSIPPIAPSMNKILKNESALSNSKDVHVRSSYFCPLGRHPHVLLYYL